MTRPRTLLLPLLALAALMVLPAGAGAATPAQDFMGVNSDGLTFDGGPKLDAGLTAMRGRRVGSVRITFYWRTLQPYAQLSDVPEGERGRFVDVGGRPTDFGPTDSVVGMAARRGVRVLPVIMGTPSWNSTDPSRAFAPPTDKAEFGRFAATLARRYGPNGSFWRANPSLPARPIRAWQIWNEPAGYLGFGDRTEFWHAPFDTALSTYRSMLKASRKELRGVDSGAQIVLSGFFGRSWLAMTQLYEANYRKLFDVVTIHPYARTVEDVVRILRIVRKVMKRYGDDRKPLMVTEFGWVSSLGRLSNNLGLDYIERSEQGQARILREAYRNLWANRGTLRLRAAYWYTWATPGRASDSPFDYAGLYRLADDGAISAKSAARAYREAAVELAGG